jgi:hypothetical protein
VRKKREQDSSFQDAGRRDGAAALHRGCNGGGLGHDGSRVAKVGLGGRCIVDVIGAVAAGACNCAILVVIAASSALDVERRERRERG